MAKSLPYFKFYCSEWNDGDVTLEDYRTQGVFINICSYYWSQECDISEEKIQKRFKNCKKQIENLKKAEIIFFVDGKLLIKFLKKQWAERDSAKHKNRANGLKGGRPKKTDSVKSRLEVANPNKRHIEEEEKKKREEEIKSKPKKEAKYDPRLVELPSNIKRDLWNAFMDVRDHKKATQSETAINLLLNKLKTCGSSANHEIERSIENSWKSIFPDKSIDAQKPTGFQFATEETYKR